jgi:hypothetical protein
MTTVRITSGELSNHRNGLSHLAIWARYPSRSEAQAV